MSKWSEEKLGADTTETKRKSISKGSKARLGTKRQKEKRVSNKDPLGSVVHVMVELCQVRCEAEAWQHQGEEWMGM